MNSTPYFIKTLLFVSIISTMMINVETEVATKGVIRTSKIRIKRSMRQTMKKLTDLYKKPGFKIGWMFKKKDHTKKRPNFCSEVFFFKIFEHFFFGLFFWSFLRKKDHHDIKK